MILYSHILRKKRNVVMIVLFLIGSMFANLAFAMNSKDILVDIYNRQGISGKGSFEMNLKVVSYRGNDSSPASIRVLFYSSGKQLVTFTEPERLKDDYFLVNGYNTWMYQKGLQRPIRISAQQKLFGDAGIAETAGINYLEDYEIIKSEENGEQYLMELKAKDQRTAYQWASFWISKENLRIDKIVLKALNGQPLKSLNYSNYTLVDGHEMATIEINNLLQKKDNKTVLEFTSIKSKTFPIEAFDPLMMGKIRL
jgi:hypothetical protein